MGFLYAQLDENNICIAVSHLSCVIDLSTMIRLDNTNFEYLGKKYINGNWIKVEQPIVEKQISDRELLEEIYLNQELNKITGGL